MAQDSKIEWTEHTINLWWGCTKVHAGCDNCYAEYLSDTRYKNNLWGNDGFRKEIKSAFKNLDKFQKIAKEQNENHRVFIGSMMDIFEKEMKLIGTDNMNSSNLRFHLFYRIDRGDYPNLTFLFLTKRPSNINKYIFESWKENPPKNVWFGTSISNQETANTLIPQLLKVNGNKFLSIEPQLGEISFRWALWHDYKNNFSIKIIDGLKNQVRSEYDGIKGIDWVIQGGESGHNKRPFNLDWAYSMKEQCKSAGIPYFFKQIDKIQSIPEDLQIREIPKF